VVVLAARDDALDARERDVAQAARRTAGAEIDEEARAAGVVELKKRESVPVPPSTVSLPYAGGTMVIWSLPPKPLLVSSPLVPVRVSLPPVPLMVAMSCSLSSRVPKASVERQPRSVDAPQGTVCRRRLR